MVTIVLASILISGSIDDLYWNGKWDKSALPPPVAPNTLDVLPQDRVVVPITFPVLGSPLWKDNFNEIRSGFRHTGIDIRAAKMTPVVAPFAGRINMKLHSFWIYGDNGYRCLGTHLNSDRPGTKDDSNLRDNMFAPNMLPLAHVEAGQLIGYVGTSGDATGPHLHFEIYDSGGILNPFPSLVASTKISSPKVIIASSIAKPDEGCVRLIGAYRSGSTTPPRIRMALVAKQTADGKLSGYTSPSIVDVETELARWEGIRRAELDPGQVIEIHCKAGKTSDGKAGWIATRIKRND